MPDPIDGAAALDIKMRENAAGAATIREYLRALLVGVWTRTSDFDGKRPFGSSSWKSDIWIALIDAGAVEGSLDENDYVETIDEKAADAIIMDAIDVLTTATSPPSLQPPPQPAL